MRGTAARPRYEWKCEQGVNGSSGPPGKWSGYSELQLMEMVAHLRMTLEGSQWDDAIGWKLERINFEHDMIDEAWTVLMHFHEWEQALEEEE